VSATVEAKDLAAAAAWATRAAPTKPPVPVLAAVPLDVTDGRLTLSGFDFEVSTTAGVSADGHLDRVHVNGALLAQVTGRMSGTVTMTVEDNRLVLTAGRKGRVRLAIVPADDYPTLPTSPRATGRSQDLAEVFPQVATACAKGEADLGLPNVLVRTEPDNGDRVHLYATDRYRMYHAVAEWDGDPIDVSVQGRRGAELFSALGGGTVDVGFHDSIVSIGDGARAATILRPAKPLPGMIPGFFTKTWQHGYVTLPRQPLLDAVKDVSFLAPRTGGGHYLGAHLLVDIHDDGVTLSSAADGLGDAEWSVDGDITDTTASPTLRFQSGLLAETVAFIPDPWIRIHLGDQAGRPVLIDGAPEPGGEPSGRARAVLMPVRDC
jgi:DNA polymerase-3 subunit beta